MFYESGVFECESCGKKYEDINHGVAAVGYGTENGQDFWLLRNSWGSGWGNHGYIKLARHSGKGRGHCGITLMASYPVV